MLEGDDGSMGAVRLYQATDPQAIREHARRAGMTAGEITRVARTGVIREDPKEQKSGA